MLDERPGTLNAAALGPRSGASCRPPVIPLASSATWVIITHSVGDNHPQLTHSWLVSELTYFPRLVETPLQRLLRSFPVLVLTGARQTGKSTLVRSAELAGGRMYLTLDELDVRDQAERAPQELVRRAPRMTLDEVQRAPDLVLAIKAAVDQRREPGRFVLTGSANLLLMQEVSESLAGRAIYLTLWPMTRGEQLGEGRAGRWELFFETSVAEWGEAILAEPAAAERWQDLALRGGYPVPAVQMQEEEERRWWFDGYTRTYLERDLQELSAIASLADFRRLMRAAALRVGNLLNQAELARDVALPPSTAQRYLNLLEVSYQFVPLPAYAVNRTKRLMKSPKVYWSDTGLALYLAGEIEPRGAHLENLVLLDVLAWRDTQLGRPEVMYWRTTKGAEVDLVIEWNGRLLPIEVKSARRVMHDDTRHLKVFMSEYPEMTRGGVILYDGEDVFWISDRILAVPWWRVL